MAKPVPTPAKIMQLGTAFWGSKTLLSAVELGLFTALAKRQLDAKSLTQRLGLHPRSARDFFDSKPPFFVQQERFTLLGRQFGYQCLEPCDAFHRTHPNVGLA